MILSELQKEPSSLKVSALSSFICMPFKATRSCPVWMLLLRVHAAADGRLKKLYSSQKSFQVIPSPPCKLQGKPTANKSLTPQTNKGRHCKNCKTSSQRE